MYEDPSGHAGLLNKITSAVKSAATAVANSKVVTKAVSFVNNAVSTVKSVATSIVNSIKGTSSSSSAKTTTSTSASKTTTSKTTTSSVSKSSSSAKTTASTSNKTTVVSKPTTKSAVSAIKTVVTNTISKAVDSYNSMKEEYGSFAGMIDAGWNYVCTATKNYVVDLGSKAEVKVKEVWSDTKALAKDAYDVAVQGFTSVAAKAQEAKQWWKTNISEPFKSTVKENFIEPIREMKESAKAFVNKAADELQKTFESIGESVTNGWNSFTTWCGEHEDTLYAIGSVVLIGGLAIGTIFCPALAPITVAACTGYISGFGISVATSLVSSSIQNGFGNYDWDGILRQAGKDAFWGAATGAAFSGVAMAASKALSKIGPKVSGSIK